MSTQPQFWVNARFLTQPMTGMQRLAYNLVKRLPDTLLVTPAAPRPIYAEIDRGRIRERPHLLPSHLWEQFVLPGVMSRGDLLWSPTGIGPIRCKQHVLTIPDLSFSDLPECFSPAFRAFYEALYPISARRARRIITISRFTRERIQAVLGVPAERIFVVELAADTRFCPQPAEEVAQRLAPLGLSRHRYLLALGAISPRKNFRRLLDAWKRLAQDYPEIEMVVVGEKGLRFSGDDTLGELPPRTRHLCGVDDELLVHLYSGALAFAYPSLYEGFGLPILEAMACGAPVLTSGTTSIPEVAGEAAILVDPLSVDEIANGLRRLIDSRELRLRLQRLGFDRSARFSWDRAARETREVLCDAIA